MTLLKIGFTYPEALAMPEKEAIEYLDAYNNMRKPNAEGTGKKYIVKRRAGSPSTPPADRSGSDPYSKGN